MHILFSNSLKTPLFDLISVIHSLSPSHPASVYFVSPLFININLASNRKKYVGWEVVEVTGRDAEPLESKPVGKDDKKPAVPNSPACQTLNGWAKTLKDAEEPLPMIDDNCQYHLVSVIYHMPI